ncbi:MAG TPA: hypothetical protein VII55_03710 [Candidatus Saccharimonadales bacterium]
MIWLRRGFVWLLSVVLFVSLIGGIAAVNFNHGLGNPSKLEGWLGSSKIYDQVTASALKQAEKSSSVGSSGSVSLNDPLVKQAAESVFSPSLVQQSVNTVINNNYAWLAGKKPVPDFKVDLSSAKQSFAKQVGQAAQAHLVALPVCSALQLSQLSIPVDLLSVTCRPATLDPKAEGDRVAQEINTNGDFLNNPVITAATLNQDQFSQSSNNTSPSQGQPYYQKLSWAPKLYQIGLKLPWIFGGLALLSVLGIVFIAVSRRRGVRRVGIVLVLAGLVLIGLKYLADASVSKLVNTATKSGLSVDLKEPVSNFIRQLEPQLVRNYLLFGVVFVVIGVVIFIMLVRSRGGGKPEPRRTPSAGQTAQELPSDAANLKLAPRRSPPTSAPELPALRPNPPSSKPEPLGKNPPPPKPPRLIQ